MAKTAQKKTVGRASAPGTKICPKDSGTMVPVRVVRHRERSGMHWVCDCGHMEPIR